MIKVTKEIDQAYRIDTQIKKYDEKRNKQGDKIGIKKAGMAYIPAIIFCYGY